MPASLTPVAPPAPPADYTAPAPTGSIVTTYAELAAEVALAGPRVIVVADGTYSGSALTTAQGHELWSENRGGAVLEFGVGFRGNGPNAGGALHGFVFDVDNITNVDSTALLSEAIVNTWDSLAPITVGTGLLIEDCTFDGNGVIGSGIQAASPGGLTVRRCVFAAGFLDFAIFAFRSGSEPDAFDPITIEDVDILGVSDPVPGSGSGTRECGIYLGHTFTVSRVRVRDVAWAGIILVNDVHGWAIYDFDIDRAGFGYLNSGGVGIYCEECHDGTIIRGTIGTEVNIGINCEWNQGSTDPWVNTREPRNYDISIEDADVSAYKVGVHWDAWVRGCTARNLRLARSWRAAVLDNNRFPDDDGTWQLPGGELPIVSRNAVDLGSCTFELEGTVPRYLNAHHLTSSAPPPGGWPATPAEYAFEDDVVNLVANTVFGGPAVMAIRRGAMTALDDTKALYRSRDEDGEAHYDRYVDVVQDDLLAGSDARGIVRDLVRLRDDTMYGHLTAALLSAVVLQLADTTAPTFAAISGSPEGVETAAKGSIRVREDGTAAQTLYLKTTPSGNTGWQVVTSS